MERALVLEGGGLRGNYTAGVLDAFLDVGLAFPLVIGVSAGAGMGCSYVSKQRGRNLRVLKEYRADPRYLSIGSLFRTGNLFGLDFIFDEIPNRLIPLDFDAFYANPARFVTVCTDCATGRALYCEKDADALTAMKGSSALPYISRMVDYRGYKVLDGAVCDPIPLKKAYAEGFRNNVVVLTRPVGYRRREELHPPPELFYRRWPALVRALKVFTQNYNDAITYVENEAAAGHIILVRPSADLGISRTEKSIPALVAAYELGLRDGAAAVETIKG
ncbi:MAG: patatin family protein [Treponema sp.]|jgi:predicted patatin/cPLA2 family phospholipase|nr:patatin family protein [Treponema sp.]